MEIDVISEVAVQVIVFQGQDFTDFRFDVGFELIQVNISKDNTRFARHCIGRRRGITPKCHYSEASKLRNAITPKCQNFENVSMSLRLCLFLLFFLIIFFIFYF